MLIGKNNLTTLDVLRRVMRNTLGVYILSDSDDYEYVARSDSDLRNRLVEHIGQYKFFWFEYAKTPREAFFKECTFFHEGNPKDTGHPSPPSGVRWTCPICKK